MRYLYINTSANTAVAWVDTDLSKVVSAQTTNNRSQVESLSALIAELREDEVAAQDFCPDFVVVSRGPAPFTGLRVGLVSARSLGFTWGVPVFGVDELELQAKAAAFFVPEVPSWVVACTDARRREVYAALFQVLTTDDGESLVMRLQRKSEDWVGAAETYQTVLSHLEQFPGVCSEEVLVTGNAAGQLAGTWQAQPSLESLATAAGAIVCQALGLAGLSVTSKDELNTVLARVQQAELDGKGLGTEPQYLRRPDVQEKKQ